MASQTRMVGAAALALALALVASFAGCKRTPADCKKVKDYFCGPNGTELECKAASGAHGSKSAGACRKAWKTLMDGRKTQQANAAEAQRKSEFSNELERRKPIIAEMEKVSASRFELGDKLVAAKSKKEKAEIQAQIDAIDVRMNELNTQLTGVPMPDAGPAK